MSNVAESANNSEKVRILLIDDSNVMRRAAVKMLGKDFDVVTAEDGSQGWRMIQDDHLIQVVFTDLNMPKMNGYQLLELIRTASDSGIQNLPVIVVTGAENDNQAKEDAFEKGATDFITKPFNSTDLKARAHAHANYQRTTKVLQETATVDPLTGLANQRNFDEQLEKDLSFVIRHNHSIAVMALEVDNFRELFLKIGRKGADNLIQQLAKVILKSVRKEDCVGRMGLFNFVVSLPTAEAEGATLLAKRIQQTVSGFKAKLAGESLDITVSIGLYVATHLESTSALQVREKAEAALKTAIAAGGNQVHTDVATTSTEPTKVERKKRISIDRLLAQLDKGSEVAIDEVVDQVFTQLEPLLKLLNDDQKNQLRQHLD